MPGYIRRVVKDAFSTTVSLLDKPQKSNKSCTRSSPLNECGTRPKVLNKNETIISGPSLTSNRTLTELSDKEATPAVDKPDEYFLKYFPRLNTKKMMIYTCADGLCGGLGDRLRGIYSVYILSVFQNRTFGIDIKKPCPIEGFIQPNVLDWRVPSNATANKTVGRASLLDRRAPPLTVEKILEKIPDTDIVRITFNEDFIDVFRFYKPDNKTFHKPGNETFHFLQHLINSDIHRIIYHGLFKFKKPFEEQLNQFFNKKIGDHKLISAHIRMGDTGGEQRHYQNDLDKIWTFLIQYRKLSDYKIFIAADNQAVKMLPAISSGNSMLDSLKKLYI